MGELLERKEYKIEEPKKPKGAEIINLDQKKQERKEENILKKIEQEMSEAEERFGKLIEEVSKRYKNLPNNIKEDLILHNRQILGDIIEYGIRRGFTEKELKISELGAILHDMDKADSVPEKYKDIQNYTLVMHAKVAAEKVPEILTDECLEEFQIGDDPENIRQEVAKAILEHMGPRPGFMADILRKFNEDMKKIGEDGIEYPEAKGKISEALLAADMKSLAGESGRKKVLKFRAGDKFFIQQDLNLVAEYEKYKIDLSQGEAALISGFESAFQARDMQKDKRSWDWIDADIEKSKKAEYTFLGSEKLMLWEDVFEKMKHYEEKRRIKEIEESLEAA